MNRHLDPQRPLHAHRPFGAHPAPRAALGLALMLALSIVAAPRAFAASFGAVGGAEYFSGPDQLNRSALVLTQVGLGGSNAIALGGIRYDDSIVGVGSALIAGGTLGVRPNVALGAWGSRFIGDETFRAWRLKTGPILTLPRDSKLGLYYQRWSADDGFRSNAALAELGVPLAAGFVGRANAAWASLPDDDSATQGAIGLGWSPNGRFEIAGEVGLANNASVIGVPVPRSRGGPSLPLIDLPLADGQPAPSSASRTDPTVLLGMRIAFP